MFETVVCMCVYMCVCVRGVCVCVCVCVWCVSVVVFNPTILCFQGHMDQVISATFSPYENNQLVSCGKQHVSFWSLDEGRLSCTRGRFDVRQLYLAS